MVPSVANVALVGAYVFLLGLVAVRYWRGSLTPTRVTMYVGLCLTWLSYGLIQVSQEGVVSTGTPLNFALDGLAIVSLVVGLAALYRWWRTRGDDPGERRRRHRGDEPVTVGHNRFAIADSTLRY